jgi:hypothetical protein
MVSAELAAELIEEAPAEGGFRFAQGSDCDPLPLKSWTN